MPGIANWKQLYQMEYVTLNDEGYSVEGHPLPDMEDRHLCFMFGDEIIKKEKKAEKTEAEWEKAYWALWSTRQNGLRKGYQFYEPDDYEEIIRDAAQEPDLIPLSENEYRERVRGAWFGRFAGVILGKPVEMVLKKEVMAYLEKSGALPLDNYLPFRPDLLDRVKHFKDCTLGNISYVACDDDVDYTVLALQLLDERGVNFTKQDVCNNWLRNIPYGRLFSCTKQAYYHLVKDGQEIPRDELIEQLPLKLNPMREGINGAIRSDMYGYVYPANPRKAAMLAYTDTSVNMTKNGKYAAMFVVGCIAAALSKNPDLDSMLKAGLSVIPKRSRLYDCITKTITWYNQNKDWDYASDKIYEMYGYQNWAGALFNIPFVVLALLHGNLDYTKTITTATMVGLDTDCNAATAGSIVGAAVGFAKLPGKWVNPLGDCIRTSVGKYGNSTISHLVDETVKVYNRDVRSCQSQA